MISSRLGLVAFAFQLTPDYIGRGIVDPRYELLQLRWDGLRGLGSLVDPPGDFDTTYSCRVAIMVRMV